MKKIVVKKNRYVDSVSLMGVSDRVQNIAGVKNTEAMMGSHANQELLRDLGYELPEGIGANDLVIAITAENEAAYAAAFETVENIIDRKNVDEETRYNDLSEIDETQEPYDLCQISLPGEYVAAEAKKALRNAAVT